MKILYLTLENMNLSKGSAVHVREVVGRLREMGCEVTLLASGNPKGRGVPAFVSFNRNPRPEGRIRSANGILWDLIRFLFLATQYLPSHDLVYARDYHVALISQLPKVFLRRRLVYEINGLASGEWLMKGDTIFNRTVTMMIKVLERFAARLADRVVVVTDGLRNYLVSNFSVEADKISVIPNGVDTKLFYPVNDSGSLEDLRARLGIQMDEFAVLFSGNLASWQGIDTLLTSVPIVLKQVPRVKFLIVGDGILRQHLQATTRKMNLEKQVLFTGMVRHEQVPRYVNLADLCVSPKRYYLAGLSPLKVYEYMACGKAVVSSRVPGLEFIEERNTGILVEPENPQTISQGIVTLFLDPLNRTHMARNGGKVAEWLIGRKGLERSSKMQKTQ